MVYDETMKFWANSYHPVPLICMRIAAIQQVPGELSPTGPAGGFAPSVSKANPRE